MQPTLAQLAVNHPYYASDSNYYKDGVAEHYDTFLGFLSDFGRMDVDLNFCYRWDISKWDDDGQETDEYKMQITLILQRKGIYKPCLINSVTEEDVPAILAYLTPHWERMKQLWMPLSQPVLE
jgi:hypothetical protein